MKRTQRRLRPRKTAKQTRAHETRQRILDAAARVFASHGYAAGTTNRIAAAADISIGSLYQYFPNKDAILVELVRRHVTEGVAAVSEQLAVLRSASASLPARIGALVDAALSTHTDDPRLHQVLFEEAPRPRELLDELHAIEEWMISTVESLLGADRAVQVDDPGMAARLVVLTIESLVHRFVSSISSQPNPVNVAAFRDELVTMLTRYLTAVRDRRAQAIPSCS